MSVEGQYAFIVHALHCNETQSVNDKLYRPLIFIGTLKGNGATRVIAVLRYLCYARKNHRTQPHDPVTSRYAAALLNREA